LRKKEREDGEKKNESKRFLVVFAQIKKRHICLKMRRYGYQFQVLERVQRLRDEAGTPALPPSVSLRDKCTPVRDQGFLGACTAFALCACLELKNPDPAEVITSPLFVYFRERVLEGDVDSDMGASLLSGATVLEQTGACLESLWPYVESKFAERPPPACYADAANRRVRCAQIDPHLGFIKEQLSKGVCVVVGIAAYASFDGTQAQSTGVVPMPNTSSEASLGGHAVALVGYDDATQLFCAKNSWGTFWGDQGYIYLPYAYILDPNLTAEIFAVPSLSTSQDSASTGVVTEVKNSTWSTMSSTQQGLFIAAMVLIGLLLIFVLVMVGLSARNAKVEI
jgi:hypothetical protein